jgi:hypothetical protein
VSIAAGYHYSRRSRRLPREAFLLLGLLAAIPSWVALSLSSTPSTPPPIHVACELPDGITVPAVVRR